MLCTVYFSLSKKFECHWSADTSYLTTFAEVLTYLSGVLGLPMIRRGERIFGSNENFSLMFSRTDGATYVKPYKKCEIRGVPSYFCCCAMYSTVTQLCFKLLCLNVFHFIVFHDLFLMISDCKGQHNNRTKYVVRGIPGRLDWHSH